MDWAISSGVSLRAVALRVGVIGAICSVSAHAWVLFWCGRWQARR